MNAPLPAGARPLAPHPAAEKRPVPERRLGAEGGALERLAAMYATDQQVEPDELGPVMCSHRSLYATIDCPGTLREIDRDEHLVAARCDRCGHETSFRPEVVDRDLRIAGIMRRAHLPARFIDEPLPPHPGTRAARAHVQALLDGWGTPDAPRPPFLVGLNGRGKTHLLTRTARQLIHRHEVRLRYVTMADLLDEAKRAMDARTADRDADTVQGVFDRAASVPLLVLDDLPALRTDWQLDTLEQLIDRRYRDELAVMGSTNVPQSRWRDAFGPRVASRLHELTAPVVVDGPDHRSALGTPTEEATPA